MLSPSMEQPGIVRDVRLSLDDAGEQALLQTLRITDTLTHVCAQPF